MLRSTSFVLLSFLFFQSQIFAQCWNLVWEDEFNGNALKSSNWSYQIGDGCPGLCGWGNNEWQYYTDRVDNAKVENGVLKIIARQESYNGSNYTSARLRSINLGDWTYGRMEASIKTPFGQGIWPAFWMMPTESAYGGWPNSGEIDIMELLGHQTQIAYGTAHYALNGGHQYQTGSYTLPSGSFSNSFHTFEVEWRPDTIEWFIDGIKYHEMTATSIAPAPWIFDKDFHFILNVAVGGNWPGYPNGSTTFPQTMEVDYVRVYQNTEYLVVQGDDYVGLGQSTADYSIAQIPGATYAWTVPGGASILSGAGTPEITVDFNNNSGQVCCTVTTPCATKTACLDVTATSNFWQNGDFEDYLNHWSTRTDNGAVADFSTIVSNPQQGLRSGYVSITNLGVNEWDVQLGRSTFQLVGGKQYELHFWAKADASGKDVRPAFITAGTFNWISGGSIPITTGWQYYTHSFTAPNSTDAIFNFDLGDEIGDFFFDDVWFGEANNLPIELGGFDVFVEKKVKNPSVLLEWTTFSEKNSDRFDIEHSVNGTDFLTIGEVAAHGNSIRENQYEFIHESPLQGQHFYRLKQVDLDGKFEYSPIRSVYVEKKQTFTISPNPTDGILTVLSGQPMDKIEVLDASGKVVLRIENVEAATESLYLGALPKGSYILRVYGGGMVWAEWFILE